MGPLGTNFSEILIKIQNLSLMKMRLKISSLIWWLFCPGGDELSNPDNKVHGANMGPTWVLSAPDGPHVGPMNLTIREHFDVKKGYTGRCSCIPVLLTRGGSHVIRTCVYDPVTSEQITQPDVALSTTKGLCFHIRIT